MACWLNAQERRTGLAHGKDELFHRPGAGPSTEGCAVRSPCEVALGQAYDRARFSSTEQAAICRKTYSAGTLKGKVWPGEDFGTPRWTPGSPFGRGPCVVPYPAHGSVFLGTLSCEEK